MSFEASSKMWAPFGLLNVLTNVANAVNSTIYRPRVNGCEDPRIDGVRRNGDEISTAVGSMLFAGKEKRGGMGEPVLRLLEFGPCGGHRVVKRYASGRGAEYCQN